MDQVEFEFPDEKEEKAAASKNETRERVEDVSFEIEDDTPEEDRGKDPLPQSLVDELDKDELDDYSEKVKVRLKQMKRVWHDERRAKEQALREHHEAISVAQRMIEENKQLKQRLSTGEQSYIDTYKSAAGLEIDAAKREYKEAYDMGDPDKILEAQEKLSNAQYKMRKATEYIPSLQQRETEVQPRPEAPVARPDPRAVSWQERNSWFGQDEEMTSLALGLHQKLVNQHGDSYTSTDEYWKKVDDTMRLRFPDYFRDSTPSQRTERASTVVAPATRSTSSKKIVLKQSQLSIAKKLGLTPEQYAREIMKMEAKNG